MTEAEVLQEPDAIRDESVRILNLFENGSVPHAKVPEAQELFRTLKKSPQAGYRRMATVRGEAALPDVEAYFFQTAIGDAWANTLISSVRWNSRPDHRWPLGAEKLRWSFRSLWSRLEEIGTDSHFAKAAKW